MARRVIHSLVLIFLLLIGNLFFITRSFFQSNHGKLSRKHLIFPRNNPSINLLPSKVDSRLHRNVWSLTLFGRKKKAPLENENDENKDNHQLSSLTESDKIATPSTEKLINDSDLKNKNNKDESSEESTEKKRRKVKKAPNIYTQPDSATFTREKMNSQMSSGSRKKISKQEMLEEMNDLDDIMSRMEESIKSETNNNHQNNKKKNNKNNKSVLPPSSPYSSSSSKSSLSSLPPLLGEEEDHRLNGHSDLDDIEEGFLKFLENNDIDMEFQKIQESLEGFSAMEDDDEIDPALLSSLNDENEEEEEEEVAIEEDDDSTSSPAKNKDKKNDDKITDKLNKKDENDKIDEEEEPIVIEKRKRGRPKREKPENEAAASLKPPTNNNNNNDPNSPFIKRKVGRKRKDEEEEFDISSFLDKEFYGIRGNSASSTSTTSSPNNTPPDELTAEDDEDLFFSEASSLASVLASAGGNNRRLNMKEELQKMEKVLRNFDNDFPSSKLDQYSLPTSPSFNAPQARKKSQEEAATEGEEEEGEGMEIGDEDEMIRRFEEEELRRKKDKATLPINGKGNNNGKVNGKTSTKASINPQDDLEAAINAVEDAYDDDLVIGEVLADEEIDDEAAFFGGGDLSKAPKRTRGRGPIPSFQFEDGHNITAEEMKEVLSSFDDDERNDFEDDLQISDDIDEDEENEEIDQQKGGEGSNKTAKPSSSSSSTSGKPAPVKPTSNYEGKQFDFDFDSLFQRMNRTETLEKELLNERAKKKQSEIQKIQMKLAQLARMNKGKKTADNVKEKKKAIRELQLQLISLRDELSNIESVQDDSDGLGDEYEDSNNSGDDGYEEGGEGRDNETEADDEGSIISDEEYDLLDRSSGVKRRRSQKKTIRNYYLDLLNSPTNENEEDENDDENSMIDSDDDEVIESAMKAMKGPVVPQMTEQQLVRAGIPFDENEVRRDAVRLTQSTIIPTRRPNSDEIVNVNITTPRIIDARYPDWKLDMRDYMANVNVSKIIQEGPNWDLIPSENDTELLKYAQLIYKRLSREQELFYDNSYAYIPPSMRETRNHDGKVLPSQPPVTYPPDEHDIALHLGRDEPMHSRLVVTSVLSAMNTTEELKKGIAMVKKLYELFDESLQSDDRVEYQLWIYCEDMIRNPYVIAEPMFKRYDYNLSRYLEDLSPEEKFFVASLKTTEQQQRDEDEKNPPKKDENKVEEGNSESIAAAVAVPVPLVKDKESENNGKKIGRIVPVTITDPQKFINYYYLLSQDYQNMLKQQFDSKYLQSEELWRSTLEGTMQMWCEGYNSYHLINGKLMKDMWGGINPEVLFAPKNLRILTERVREALDEDSYNALSLTPRMKNDWKVGDMLYPPEDLTEIDYSLTE